MWNTVARLVGPNVWEDLQHWLLAYNDINRLRDVRITIDVQEGMPDHDPDDKFWNFWRNSQSELAQCSAHEVARRTWIAARRREVPTGAGGSGTGTSHGVLAGSVAPGADSGSGGLEGGSGVGGAADNDGCP